MDDDNEAVHTSTTVPEPAQNGAPVALIVRDKGGKFLPGTKSPAPITHENARTMRERRKDLTAQKMRAELAARGRTEMGVNDGPAAVLARAAGQMFSEIVINPDANPRYRADTWQMIGRHAGMLGDNRENQAHDGVTVTVGADIAREIVAKMMDIRAKQGQE